MAWRVRLAAVSVLVVATILASAPPADAQAVPGISIYVHGQESGPLGSDGEPRSFEAPADVFEVRFSGSGLDITVYPPGIAGFMVFQFDTGTDEPLRVGSYPNAAETAAQGGPNIRVYGASGCYPTRRSFEVLELQIDDPNTIRNLAIDFEMHCEDRERSSWGSIRINSAIPIDRAAIDERAFMSFLELHPSDCPQLTDSVYRLYWAYFLRDPESSGWSYWLATYRLRETDLETLSWSFSASEEFRIRYGALSNREFVELIYWNVLGRAPDPVGWTHWTTALDQGYGRGAVMLAFSESEEFVLKTETVAPMAGYLMWYTNPMTYTCGTSNGTADLGLPFFDVMVVNTTSERTDALRLRLDVTTGYYDSDQFQLGPNGHAYLHNQDFSSEGPYQLTVFTSFDPDTSWAVVSYDHPHARWRPPWIDGDAALRSEPATPLGFLAD